MILLAIKNILRRKNRTCLAVVITMITMSIFTLAWNVYTVINSGFELNESRMGADIVLYPATAQNETKDLLYSGVTEMVYMDEENLIESLPQNLISKQTSEFFLQTLPGAGCCATDDTLKIVGIDADTDFIIKPWILKELDGKFSDTDLIAGSDIKADFGDVTTFLNTTFDVKGKLFQTGSGLDDSIFVDINQARMMAKKTFSSNYFNEQNPENIISCYMIKLKEGITTKEFLNQFDAEKQGAKVAVISEEREKLKLQNQGLLKLIWIFWCAIAIITMLALGTIYKVTIQEKKREIGYLRAIGMNKGKVFLSLFLEVGLQGAVGGILGALAGCLLLTPMLEELQKICLVSVGEWTVSTICIHFAESVLVSIIISLLVVLPSILNEGNKEIQSLLSEGEL